MITAETKASIKKVFEEATAEVVSTVTGLALIKAPKTTEELYNFAGFLPLYGDINILFLIKTDENSLRIITADMTGAEYDSVDERDMRDCIGELANMICGLSKARSALGGITFSLSTPFSIKGVENIDFSFKKNVNMIVLPFESSEVSLTVRLILV